jgi:hypothetical protein
MLLVLAGWVVLRLIHQSRTQGDPVLGFILIVAAISRAGVGLVNHYLGPLPGAKIDAIWFDETARTLALVPSGPSNFVIELGRAGYSSILAVFYMIGGYHFFLPTLVNTIFIIEFLILVYRIGQNLGGPQVARVTAFCAALYPTSLVYTAVPLREAPLLWALALYVHTLIQYYDGERRLINLRLFASLGFLVWLHDGFALAIFLIPIALWFKNNHLSVGRRALFLGAGAAVILVAFAGALTYFDFRKMPADPAKLLDPEWLARMREVKSAYGVGYGAFEPTWGGIVKSAPLLLFAFVASPFPIWWQSMGELPKLAEGVLSLVLTVAACITAYQASAHVNFTKRKFILAMFLYLVFVFAMGTGNTGIAARHRAKFIWMPILLNTAAYYGRTVREGSPPLRAPLGGATPKLRPEG